MYNVRMCVLIFQRNAQRTRCERNRIEGESGFLTSEHFISCLSSKNKNWRYFFESSHVHFLTRFGGWLLYESLLFAYTLQHPAYFRSRTLSIWYSTFFNIPTSLFKNWVSSLMAHNSCTLALHQYFGYFPYGSTLC